jgi:hypothetical protein
MISQNVRKASQIRFNAQPFLFWKTCPAPSVILVAVNPTSRVQRFRCSALEEGLIYQFNERRLGCKRRPKSS